MTENDLQKFKQKIIPLDGSKKSVMSMLLELIKEEKADHLILASQRRSGSQKLTEGSLTVGFIKISSVLMLVVAK